MMDGVQDFNSSDLEFSDGPAPAATGYRRPPGQASIDKMIANAEQDRISSKKTIKKLQFQGAAPGTRKFQNLWVTRFNAYREHTLHQSLDVPFTGADVIRFLDSIISKIKPGAINKPAPNLDLAENAYQLLIKYGMFRWSKKDGFEVTSHDGQQFKAFAIQAVHQGRLVKGHWFSQTWVGFVTLSRMVRVFLEHCLQNGACNFDVVISKCLSVVLVASLGARSGDVARSEGYTGAEYVQYKHIELYLEAGAGGGRPRFQDLRAVVTLDYEKGFKDFRNRSSVKYLRPLDTQSIHVCPIALLLVHTLRNGLVHGTTLEEVLAHTAAQPDLRVKWKYPERPVLTAFARKGTPRCELDVVAEPRQVRTTMKLMGIVSGMLDRVYGHSLRLGALRDYAHLKRKNSSQAPSTDDVRRVAGHSFQTMHTGVTERYIGDLAHEYYNERAEGGGVQHRREPAFALAGGRPYLEAIQKRVSAEEMQAYADKHKPGQDASALKGSARRALQVGVRRERQEVLSRSWAAEPTTRQTASNKAAPPYPAPAPPPRPPYHAQPDDMALSRNKAPPLPSEESLGANQEAPPTAAAPSPGPHAGGRAAAAATTTPAEEGTAREDLVFLSNIDPALLDEDTLASLEVAKEDVDALQAVVLPDAGAPGAAGHAGEGGDGTGDPSGVLRGVASQAAIQDNMEEAARVLLGHEGLQQPVSSSGSPPVWTASDDPAVWTDGYAKYNVVNNTSFAGVWRSYSEGKASFEESVGQHSTYGNSRDDPTPYIFHCRRTEGCNFIAITHWLLRQHEETCSELLVTLTREKEAQPVAKILRCTHTGCKFETTVGEKSLAKHVKRMHSWEPRTCDDCDDDVVYQKSADYDKHRESVHSGRWPSKCLVPDCPEEKDFTSRPTLVYHLKTKHGLSTTEEVLPYIPSAAERGKWFRQKCVVPTCTSDTLFHSKGHMVVHLTSAAHKMDEKAAKELVDRDARKEAYVPKKLVLGPAGNAKRRKTQRTSFVAPAPGKENDPPAAMDGVQDQQDRKDGTADADEPKLKKPRAKKT